MRSTSHIVALILAISSAGAHSQDETITVTGTTIRRATTEGEVVQLTYPLIQFKVIAVPSAGTIQIASGGVDRFTPHGWVTLHAGDVLEDGARFQVEVGASAKIFFSAQRVLDLSSQQEVRGFEVHVVASE